MFYGSVAAFGLTILQEILIGERFWLRLIGGIFLLCLGIRTLLSKPAGSAVDAKSASNGLMGIYLSTVFLTVTNPATIISFTVIFAGLGIANRNDNSISAVFLVSGVFLGSASWWLTLSTGIGFVRERFTPEWLIWVNRTAGAIIVVFGAAALTTLMRS
jgi:threonine/homoserine/homoserine lactone efflux protein